ncbi:MAG: DUF2218 domain-containing protein [Chloroflexota bacterium]
MVSEARVATTQSVMYMQRLCRHFRHKVPAEFDDTHAKVDLPTGICEMDAEADALVLQAQADDTEGLERVKHILTDHITRFGFCENLQVQWSDEATVEK